VSHFVQGKKVAEHRFKAIGEAYAILKDETKKRRYDRGVPKEKCDDASSDYGYGGGGGGFGGFDDDDFGGFGGGFGGGRRAGGNHGGGGFRRR
jgi:DnaJ-class molecular chaperone